MTIENSIPKFETVQEARQAAFEIAVRGLASQNWEQCSSDGLCLWNVCGKPGKHCAVGWLIPIENQLRVVPEMQMAITAINRKLLRPEFNDFLEKERSLNSWEKNVVDDLRSFLSALQRTHDCSDKKMALEFYIFGQARDLSWPSDVPVPANG